MRKSGFTAIEVCIIIAICGLLFAIAYPSASRAHKIHKLMEKGFNRADAIKEYDRERNKDTPDASSKSNEQTNNGWNSSDRGTSSGNRLTGLPEGASNVKDLGGGWYTFEWTSHKWLARSGPGEAIHFEKAD